MHSTFPIQSTKLTLSLPCHSQRLSALSIRLSLLILFFNNLYSNIFFNLKYLLRTKYCLFLFGVTDVKSENLLEFLCRMSEKTLKSFLDTTYIVTSTKPYCITSKGLMLFYFQVILCAVFYHVTMHVDPLLWEESVFVIKDMP